MQRFTHVDRKRNVDGLDVFLTVVDGNKIAKTVPALLNPMGQVVCGASLDPEMEIAMFQEVIVCDQCEAEGCTVREITVQPVNPRLTMTEFAEKHGNSRGKTQVREEHQQANNRAFEIKCLRCGHTHRFQPGEP